MRIRRIVLILLFAGIAGAQRPVPPQRADTSLTAIAGPDRVVVLPARTYLNRGPVPDPAAGSAAPDIDRLDQGKIRTSSPRRQPHEMV